METSVIDKLFLELSQVSKGTTARELALIEEIRDLRDVIEVALAHPRIENCRGAFKEILKRPERP